MLYVNCSKCGETSKLIRKEAAGMFLILVSVVVIVIFGFTTGTMIFAALMMVVGGCWILAKPSKKYLCNNCTAD